MGSFRSRLIVLTAAPLLVVSLSACVPASEPEPGQPQTPEATPTETVAAPTPPGPRIPVTCEELFAGLDGFTGDPAEPVEFSSAAPVQAILDQAGFAFCQVDGRLGATAVSITSIVGVDFDVSKIQGDIDTFEQYGGIDTISGGELSWTECRAADQPGYCLTNVYANGYLFEFSTSPEGSIAADFDAALRSFAQEVGSRMAAWPAAPPPWVAPEGALSWSSECDTDVAATDGGVRAAMPFDSRPPIYWGSGDGFPLIYTALSRQGFMECAWESSGEDFGFAVVIIAPGAGWILEQGQTLPGRPIDYPGALAATVVDESQNSSVVVWMVIDDSLLVIDLDTGYLIDDRPGEIAAALRVADAVVADFGAP